MNKTFLSVSYDHMIKPNIINKMHPFPFQSSLTENIQFKLNFYIFGKSLEYHNFPKINTLQEKF